MKLPRLKMPTVRWDLLANLAPGKPAKAAPAPRPTVSRRAFNQREASTPKRLRLRDMALIWAGAAVFAAAAIGLVHLRMSTRDDEIETRRLQDQLLVQRDLSKDLEAGLGTLQRREVLREVAITSLGMVEPSPENVGELTIDNAAWRSWRMAETRARQRLEANASSASTGRKEVR